MLRYMLMVLIVMTLVGSTVCNALESPTTLQTQSLIQASGVKNQMGQIASLVQFEIYQAIQGAGQPLPQEFHEKLVQTVNASFDPTVFLGEVQISIERGLSNNDVEAVLQWLTSPLGTKITRLEEEGSRPDALAEMESMKVQLLMDAGRVTLIQRFDDAIKGSEYSVDLVMNAQRAMASSLASLLAPPDPTHFDQIQTAVEANRAQVLLDVRDRTLLSLLYTYRTLTEEDLNRYIGFISSEVGTKYLEAMKAGMKRGFLRASSTVAQTLVQTFRR